MSSIPPDPEVVDFVWTDLFVSTKPSDHGSLVPHMCAHMCALTIEHATLDDLTIECADAVQAPRPLSMIECRTWDDFTLWALHLYLDTGKPLTEDAVQIGLENGLLQPHDVEEILEPLAKRQRTAVALSLDTK